MRYLFYSEALLVRERALDFPRSSRAMSFLSYFENRLIKNRQKKMNILATLYEPSFLKSIDID